MPKNLYEVIFQRVGCEPTAPVKVLGDDPRDAQFAAITKLNDTSYDALDGKDILSITCIAEDVG